MGSEFTQPYISADASLGGSCTSQQSERQLHLDIVLARESALIELRLQLDF